jgi:hypothetical protein
MFGYFPGLGSQAKGLGPSLSCQGFYMVLLEESGAPFVFYILGGGGVRQELMVAIQGLTVMERRGK